MKKALPFTLLVAPLIACSTVISLGGAPVAGDASDGGDASVEVADRIAAPVSCAALPSGTTTRTLRYAGQTRTYDVVRGPGIDTCAKPKALFGFHPRGSAANPPGKHQDVVIARAAAALALAIFPSGSTDPSGISGWDCSGCTGYEQADDVGFIGAIIDDLGLDRGRSVAIGQGFGGAFVHRLVAELPLSAGAVVGGVLGASVNADASGIRRPTAKAPAAFFIQHSQGDTVFPVAGGKGSGGDVVPPLSDSVQFWRRANGCTAETAVVQTTAVSRTETFACNGHPIVAVLWAGSPSSIPATDPENPDIELPSLIDRLLDF